MTQTNVVLKVTSPQGGEPVGGILASTDFAGSFQDEAALGATVRVRVKSLKPTKDRLYLTMQDVTVPVADLKVGQTLQGRVRSWMKTVGVFVDVGADHDGFLAVEEFCDGFPTKEMKLKPGANISVRVLKIEGEQFWLTRRSGDLARSPPSELLTSKVDVSPFVALGPGDWLEGEVVHMAPPKLAVVKVKPPLGGEAVLGLVNFNDFSSVFIEEAMLGSMVKVRVKKADVARSRLILSMRSGGATKKEDVAEEAAPGATVLTEEVAQAKEEAEPKAEAGTAEDND